VSPAVEFGPVRPDEAAALLPLVMEAFSVRPGTERARITTQLVRGAPDQFVALRQDGRLVAAAHIAQHHLRLGRSTLLKADVGHVCVAPQRQGQGLGAALLTRLVRFLAAEGYHFSRLGGLMHFYSRFGYVPFPRRYLDITVPDLRADLKGRNWGRWLAQTDQEQRAIRPYKRELDGHRVLQLRTDHPLALDLSQRLDPAQASPPPPRERSLVYERDGDLRAFAWIAPPSNDNALDLRELLWDAAHPEAVGSLVKHIVRLAARERLEIRTRLPYQPALCEALTASGVTHDLRERRQAIDGNMVRVLSLHALCHALLPELAHRLQSLGLRPCQRLGLAVGDQTVDLLFADGHIRIGQPGSAAQPPPLPVPQGRFLRWVLGLETPAETLLDSAALTPDQRLLFLALFPRLPAVSNTWG